MANPTAETICRQGELPLIVTNCLEFETYIKGHHVYKNIWTPMLGEILQVRREPENIVDKFAVCVEKDDRVVGHLKKGDSGKFAKTIFYFIRSDVYSQRYVEINGKRCNLGDGEGLQVPCKICITGQKHYLDILKRELMKINEI